MNKHIDLSKRHIEDWHRKRDLLVEELSKDPVGYLVLAPSLLRAVFHDENIDFFDEYKTEMLIPLSEEISPDLRRAFCMQSIPVRGNYSSEEVGVIGCECQHYPGSYHVAHSNVIVEIDKHSSVDIGGNTLSRVLLTHLHSHATPFIRYDVGDLGALADCCKCGHDGPAISDVVGRTKNLIKHADGRLTPFLHLREGDMIRRAKVDEFRVRQTTVNDIVLELSGCGNLTEDQHSYFTELIKKHAGVGFNVDIRIVEEIDWGQSVKRPAFRNELIS
jgi:phenylacetate-CoA ligase